MTRSMNAVVVVVALLCGATQAGAAAPKSLVGTWRVVSVTVRGEESKYGFNCFTKNAVWKLKKDGKATAGGDDWTWTYDADDKEFVMQRPIFFGLGEEKRTMSVTSAGKNVKLEFETWVAPFVIELRPED